MNNEVNMNDLVSIIVPIYMVEKYLNKCIKSLVDQTYKNIEIILVDDGSSDGSSQICDNWREKDSRIKVIHKKNGGLSSARNAGIELATGKYLMFVDSDDYVQVNYVQFLYQAIIENKAQISCCNFLYVDEKQNLLHISESLSPIRKECLSGIEVLQEYYKRGCGHYYVIVCNKMFHRDIFKDIRFPLEKYHEDEFIFHDIFLRAPCVAFIEDSLYYYVQRQTSIIHTQKGQAHRAEAYYVRFMTYKNKNLYSLLPQSAKAVMYESKKALFSMYLLKSKDKVLKEKLCFQIKEATIYLFDTGEWNRFKKTKSILLTKFPHIVFVMNHYIRKLI